MKEGIINIYKEKGYTSFDVVAILRKKFGIKKIGHTGTLDPQAEGVLPICLGKATKVVDYITDYTKVYVATMKLGAVTDTQDHTGKVLSTMPVTCTKEQIESAIYSFIGDYEQIPPMYSAIKVNGQKLYDLARKGITVERKSRTIKIYSIEIISIQDDNIELRVTCSKGTYIRTLCHDIGQKLGCGAHMTDLIRERTGPYEAKDALRLSQIDELIESGKIEDVIQPIDKVFIDSPTVTVDSAYNTQLMNGNKLLNTMLKEPEVVIGKNYRVYREDGAFIGVYECKLAQGKELFLKPVTLFI